MQRLKITTRTFALAVACLMAAAAPIITLGQQPPEELPEEQNPWYCYDFQGHERECSATENYTRCLRVAAIAYFQCELNADGFVDRAFCDLAYNLDAIACGTRFLTGFIV